MASKINWTDLSIEDITNIAEFISKDSFHFAQIQTERFINAAKVLEKFPMYGKMVPEFTLPELRELIEGNYRIIYRIVSDERIDILTIHHSSRLLSNNPLFEGK
jgi:toxin ParE1/3/4